MSWTAPGKAGEPVDTTNPRNAATGQPVSWQIDAQSSRPGTLRFSAKGLPRGLTIDSRTGLVSGTPEKGGTYRPSVTIRDAAGDRRTVRYRWTVLTSGGDFFVNPGRYDIANWQHIESPVTVSGRQGNAPADLKVSVDLYAPQMNTSFYMIELVSEDGQVIPVQTFSWPPTSEWTTELHKTFTVDASAVPANGTWKLRVQDDTPGIFAGYPAGYLDTWSMSF
jgi:hypothetical protein